MTVIAFPPHCGTGWTNQPVAGGAQVVWRPGNLPGERIDAVLAVSAAQAVQALYWHPNRRPIAYVHAHGVPLVEHQVDLTGVRMLVFWCVPEPIYVVQPLRLARAPFN